MKENRFFFVTETTLTGRRHGLSWVEDSFGGSNTGDDYLSLSLSSRKRRLLAAVIMGGLALLLGKAVYLQIIQGDHYLAQADNNRLRTTYVKPPRGIIYDSHGQSLVQNVSGFSLVMVPANLPKDETARRATIDQVAGLVAMSTAEIEAKLQEAHAYYYQPIVIKTGIEYDNAMLLKIKSSDLPGVSVEVDSWRSYVYGTSTAHALGYVGKLNAEEYKAGDGEYLLSDNIGKSGLEKQYEKELRGIYGQTQIEVDSYGRPKKVISESKAVSGSDVVLAIDSKLQEYIYTVLQNQLKEQYNAAVIVSNPQNGEILALVDYPSYNGNLFSRGISSEEYKKLLADPHKPLYARSVMGEYPSGSTIKPVVAAAALNEGIVTRDTTVLSTGGLHLGQWTFPDWKGGGHGVTNVTKAIADSVNTFFYYVGGGFGDFPGLGVEKLTDYYRRFALGKPTGIDLPSEQDGFIPSEAWKEEVKGEQWYIGDTYHLAIGQGDLTVTPLQINQTTATVANGGTIYRPHLVHEIKGPAGRLIEPEVVSRVDVSAEALAIVRDGMRQTVVSGSARSLSSLPVEAAGKTGTAQWNTHEKNHAWFTGFAPFNNPTIAITVLVEAGGEGSSIATPIAREVLKFIFASSSMPRVDNVAP
ncbi:MAG: penicillin-binding protein 2 [Candidatus Buchananbacteria bacterium]|nr:penicillin-binding protein 2 [Candidatus Buchananbacteria bacterium]